MEPTPTVPADSAPDAPAETSAPVGKIEHALVVARARIDQAEARARAQVREAIDRVLRAARDTVRAGLHLPSQAEIEALIARVEELDRRLAALSVPPPAAEPPAADEAPRSRKKKNGR